MSLVLTTRCNSLGNYRSRDPLALFANELLGFDPFRVTPGRAQRARFSPSVEVRESEDAYRLIADLPGVSEDALEISVEGNELTISGSRAAREKSDDETYLLFERGYGSFTRTFKLPEQANNEAIDAKLDGGVLTLTIQKKADARPKKIKLGARTPDTGKKDE